MFPTRPQVRLTAAVRTACSCTHLDGLGASGRSAAANSGRATSQAHFIVCHANVVCQSPVSCKSLEAEATDCACAFKAKGMQLYRHAQLACNCCDRGDTNINAHTSMDGAPRGMGCRPACMFWTSTIEMSELSSACSGNGFRRKTSSRAFATPHFLYAANPVMPGTCNRPQYSDSFSEARRMALQAHGLGGACMARCIMLLYTSLYRCIYIYLSQSL